MIVVKAGLGCAAAVAVAPLPASMGRGHPATRPTRAGGPGLAPGLVPQLGPKGQNIRSARVDRQLCLEDVESRISKAVAKLAAARKAPAALTKAAVRGIAQEVIESSLVQRAEETKKPSAACLAEVARKGRRPCDLYVGRAKGRHDLCLAIHR